jgi:hypothetical protein
VGELSGGAGGGIPVRVRVALVIVSTLWVALLVARPASTRALDQSSAPRGPGGSCAMWILDSLTTVGPHRPTVLGNPREIETPRGRAIAFDGIDDALVLGANPLAGARAFTIEAIFRPDTGGQPEQRFLHVQEIEDRRILLETRLTDANAWFLDTFIKSGASERTLQSRARTHPLGEWYHAALVYEGGRMRHFVNGVEEMTGAVDYAPTTGGQVSIGCRLNRVYWFRGAIRGVRFCDRALESREFDMAGQAGRRPQ